MPPVCCSFAVELHSLIHNSAVEQRYRVVRGNLQSAIEEIEGSLVIGLRVTGFGASEMGAGKLDHQSGRAGLEGEAPLEVGNGGIVVAIEQFGETTGLEPSGIIWTLGQLACNYGLALEEGRGTAQAGDAGGSFHHAQRAVSGVWNAHFQIPLSGERGGEKVFDRGLPVERNHDRGKQHGNASVSPGRN